MIDNIGQMYRNYVELFEKIAKNGDMEKYQSLLWELEQNISDELEEWEYEKCDSCEDYYLKENMERGTGLCKECYNTPPIVYSGVNRY